MSAASDAPVPGDDSPHDWRPTCTIQSLRVRSVMLRAAREFFHDHQYMEVETPLLSHDVVVDAHLNPFVAAGTETAAESGQLYLQTSPEAGMKRLLAAGTGSIFQITRSFRHGEFGERHNPEFTMIEWYGVGTDHHQQMQFSEQLVRYCVKKAEQLTGMPSAISMEAATFGRTSYDAAFHRTTGAHVIGCEAEDLLAIADQFHVDRPDSLDCTSCDQILNLLLATLVEPTLGTPVPEFIFGYPASQAALACLSQGDPRTADRFELYAGGIELCNGYRELTDPDELRSRDEQNNFQRAAENQPPLPGAARMQRAMEAGLPACSGVALGFDRLVMVAMNAKNIAEVIPFPISRA